MTVRTAMPFPPIRVLVVDDEAPVRDAVASLLVACGADVVGSADGGRSAVEAARVQRPDVVVMDLRMPDLDGISAAELIRLEDATVQVVVHSAYDDAALQDVAAARGIYAYVVKGCRGRVLVDTVTAACGHARAMRGDEG